VLQNQLEKMRNAATEALGPGAVEPKQLAMLPDSVASTSNNSTPAGSTPAQSPQSTGRNVDLPTSNGGGSPGGGAIDPLTAAIALAIAGLAWAASKGRQRAA